VQDEGRRLGLAITVVEFEAPTRTAADAAAAVGSTVGQIVKSLVFLVAGQPVVCLVAGSHRLDEGKLAAWAGVDRSAVARADAESVRAATGYAIGGVAPFGYPQPLPVLCDADLLQYPVVWAAAGTPHAVFAVRPHDLVSAIGAQVLVLAQEHSA
jgi:prolyl-tRNA editing enzyme YbaK/EbsC (Cys-tRNA(Pro) deacylase)